MTFINITTIFLVLFVFIKICETWSYRPILPPIDNRRRFIHEDLLPIFDDEGSIRFGGIEKYTDIGRIHKFGAESNEDPYEQLQNLMGVKIDPSNILDHLVNSSSIDGDSDWLEQIWKNIEVQTLEASPPLNLSSDQFHWQSNTTLKILSMRFTQVENVAEDTLESVGDSLRILDLANAKISANDTIKLIKSLSKGGSTNGPTLRLLNLAKLGLTNISYDLLESVQYSLHALSFFGNDFRTINDDTRSSESEGGEYKLDDLWESEFEDSDKSKTRFFGGLLGTPNASSGSSWANFPQMPFLVQLDLRNCKINTIESGTFLNLGNLKHLLLSNNRILSVANHAFEGLKNLMFLDLNFNNKQFEKQKQLGLILHENSFKGLHLLLKLNISNTFLHSVTSNHLNKLPSTLLELDLRETKLISLPNGIFERLVNLQVLDLSDNYGLCLEVTADSFRGLESLQELYMAHTSLTDLGVLQDLSLLKILDVKSNGLNKLTNVLKNFPLLEFLDVSNNFIGFWSNGRIFANNRRLNGVFFHNNILSLMSEDMFEDLKSLEYMTVANNSFVCNCQLKEFAEYYKNFINITEEGSLYLIGHERSDAVHNCTDLTLSKTFRFEDTDKYCLDELSIVWLSTLQHIVYIFLLLSIVCMSIGTLVYWKWWYIRYVAVFMKNATVLSIINIENSEDRVYSYDIFVSYSDENRIWIFEELIPNMEGQETNLNICLHERDFQVGVSILENIITGMDQSRTILLVISSEFIKSQWCQFEMHMAQHRLIETCREELVMIFLEEIPRERRSKILNYLMMVKTYVVWPKDSNDKAARKLFWKRLRRAITTKNTKKNFLANEKLVGIKL